MINLISKVKNFFYYERVVLYGYDLTKHHNFESKIGMEICQASLEDVKQLYNDEMNTDLKSIELNLWNKKISNGSWKGFIVKDGDDIVAQAFYSTENIFFGGTKKMVLNLPLNSGYGFKLYTRPDYRGRKLGQAVTSFRLNNAKNAGIKKFYTVIRAENIVSRHNEEKIGGFLVGSVIFLKCRFFNKVFLSPGIWKAGIRKSRKSNF